MAKVRIGDIAVVTSGNSAPQDKAFFVDGKYPFVRTGDVGRVHLDSCFVGPDDYLNDMGVAKLRLFPKNSLLFPKSGASTLLNHRVLLGEDSYVVSHLAIIIPNEEKVLPKYLYYASILIDAGDLVDDRAYPSLRTSTLENVMIEVPSIEEQRRIVYELDLFSDILKKKERQVANLDALVQSLFYEVFGDPVINPNSWPVVSLDSIANLKIGLTYKPENVCDNGIIVLRSSNIRNSEIDLNDVVRVDCPIKEQQFVKQGDILMCSRNGSIKLVGKVARIGDLSERMSYGAFMTTIRSPYNSYLFEFFKLPAFRVQLGLAKTATINQITVKMLANTKVALPPKELQESFEKKVFSIYEKKAFIGQSIKNIQDLLHCRMSKWFV